MPVERMEELVLVYGCTLVTSWAAAAFDDYGDAQISLTNSALSSGGTNFHWGNIRGIVEYHDGQVDPVCSTLATSTRRALRFTFFFFFGFERMAHTRARITACSSSASEQSASCSGPDTSMPQQNPFPTTLTIVKEKRYK